CHAGRSNPASQTDAPAQSPGNARRPLLSQEGTAAGEGRIIDAIHRTIAYANLFQYPLTPDELRERLFDVEVDAPTFQRILKSLDITPSDDLLRLRASREAISDRGIQEM